MPPWLNGNIVNASGWAFLCRYLTNDEATSFDLGGLGIGRLQDASQQLDQAMMDASKVFKNDRTTSVGQLDLKDGEYIAKRYNARNTKHHFTRAVRKSRAQRCWDMSFEFARIGLNVAAPAMMYEKRLGPFRLDAYFVNEKLSGVELLTALPTMTQVQKERVVVQIHDAFSKMRKAKVTHGDMKATNLMWVDEQLYFIDLDASKCHRSDRSFARANKKDKKRFMKNWKDKPELFALFSQLP